MSIQYFPGAALEGVDVCVVGSGPAGLSLALEFAESSLSVCVLESGGNVSDPAVEALNEIESVGLRRAPQDVTRRRGFGGTSAIWSGRCGVFDAMDFAERPWLARSGWPIDDDDVAPYLDRAGRLLQLGPAFYREEDYARFRKRDGAPDWRRDLFRPVVWQFSASGDGASEPVRAFAPDGIEGAEHIGALQHAGAPKPVHFGESFSAAVARSQNIKLVLGANVTMIDAYPDETQVRGVTIKALSGEIAKLRARVVVLACGGIDNARLLLCSRGARGRGLGNARDQVGRYLSDHPFGTIASYHGPGSKALRRRLGHRWIRYNGSRHIYSMGLRLAPDVQRREELLNAAIHLVDRGERSSAVVRAGAAVRLAKASRFDRAFTAEVAAALSDPIGLARGVYSRYLRNEPQLEVPNRVDFGCVVEQVPDPESRVTLSASLDALGMPRARIDWRASDREHWTARRMAELLRLELARIGLDPPVFAPWLDEGPGAFRALVHDMAHPMGTTRMSSDPADGVVDRNCEVHGVSGLYVAGGSVFATPGYMNPTLTIVALSLRLADHIKRVLASADGPAKAVEAEQKVRMPHQASVGTPTRAKIAFVGVGDRVRTIYLPVLSALRDRFEIVGATSRSPDGLARFGLEHGVDTFGDASAMVHEAKPDFVVVAVSPQQIETALPSLIALGTPLLVETPIAWSLRRGRAVVRAIENAGAIVGVAEQTPFLPAEQLKRRLIDLGVIGCVRVAENDFAVYDYHGVAAARAYLPGRRALTVSATAHRSPAESGDGWTCSDLYATVSYDDGSTLVHRYGDPSATSRLRESQGLRVFGSDGTLANETLIVDASASRTTTCFERNEAQGSLQALSVETPLGRVTWRNPFARHALSDEQIAVGALLTDMSAAAAHRRSPLYDARRAFQDMEILEAMRLSALRGGSPVRLPVGVCGHAFHAGLMPKLARVAGIAKSAVFTRLRRAGATT